MKLPGPKKKKTVSCPRCHRPVPPDTAFCDSCGARIGSPPSCSLCGTLLTPGARFCSSCGTMVGNSKDNPAIQPEPPAEIPAPARKPGTSRAKKTRAADVEEHGKEPDPLMMIPEPDSPGTADETGVPEKTVPEKNRAPDPKSPRVTLPSKDRNRPIPVIFERKNLAIIAVVAVLVAVAALVSAGILHINPYASFGAGTTVPVDTTIPVPAETTPVPVTELTEIPGTAAGTISLVPGPTQVPPDNLLVYFQAERDPLTRMVSVLYMGGKGQRGVQDVFVRLTRSDGQVLTGTFKPEQVGSGVELQGTEKTDRVEVIVHYFTGDEYTVIDKVFEYKKLI
jgi:Double zinc ribbon